LPAYPTTAPAGRARLPKPEARRHAVDSSSAGADEDSPASSCPYTPTVSLEFLLTSLIVVASPGTGVLYTIAAGLSGGRRTSLIAAIGCTLGIVPHMLAAVLGVAAVLHSSAIAFDALKLAGVGYLLYLAWQTLRDEHALTAEPSADPAARTARRVVGRAILVNVLNPKLSIFFVAFLPQFVSSTDVAPLARMLELSGVFMAMTLVVFAGYGLAAAAVRQHVLRRPHVITWMRRAFAGAFVALGLRLALQER
jgi:threonine/homoserine/homoserine lactone efflux protein